MPPASMPSGTASRLSDALVDRAIVGGARLSGHLPSWMLGGMVCGATWGARLALARRLRANLRRALGPERPLRSIERAFFARAAEWGRYTVSTFHRGFARSGFAEEGGVLHDSFAHVERAAALGRGVVLVATHQFGHELFAPLVHRRVPLVIVIRQESGDAARALAERWYQQLGIQTIQRPPHARAIADFRALLRVLRRGQLLALTPDLPGRPGEGEPVCWFGRSVVLRAGAFWLALRGRAPIIRCWIDRVGSRPIMRFSPPETIESDPEASPSRTVQRHLQEWTTAFEQELRARPEGWSFWVDRRWTAVLQRPAGPEP